MKDLSKTWVLTRKQIEDFRQKKRKRKSRPFKNTQWNTRPLNVTTEEKPGKQAEKNWRKIEKSIQIGTFGTLQN